jgi:type I restriction enzyme S subunit
MILQEILQRYVLGDAMREMKDSGIEWVGAIPAAWGVHRIASHFQEIKEKNTANAYSNALQFKMGKIIAKPQKWDEDETNETYSAYTVVHPNTIMINGLNLEFDFVTQRVARVECNGIITSAYIALSPRNDINAEYICYLLKSYDACRAFHSMGRGLRKILSYSELKNKPIVVPPLAKQEHIAAFLDAECAEIDAVLEKTRASIEEYKKLKQAIITQAVTKGIRGDRPMKDSGIEWIGDIPAEWDVIRVKQLLKERNERSKEGKEEPLSMSQKVGLVPTKFLESIPNMASSFVGAKLAYVDDLVFNKLKAHLGVFSVSRYDGLVSPDYAVYCSTGKSNLKYLEYIFKTPQCIGEFRKKSTGIAAGLMRLYTEGLFSIYLPYPALSEQEEIAEYLNEKCAGIDALIAKKQQYLTEIENYKKSLIYEYVTGKKEVV